MRTIPFYCSIIILPLLVLLFSGCGEQQHGKNESHEEVPSGAWFKAGKGVMFTEETRQILGVETAEVVERKLSLQLRFTAQVFGETHKSATDPDTHTECTAKASGLVSPKDAGHLRVGHGVQLTPKAGQSLGGIVLRVNKSLALGDAEVIVGVTNAGAKLKPGEFVLANVAIPGEQSVTVVPQSAVLHAAEGTFVYTLNGDAYFRTAVTVGAHGDGYAEITDGLLNGDVVVTRPVEKLWLIELRATKGGGHCH